MRDRPGLQLIGALLVGAGALLAMVAMLWAFLRYGF